MRSHHEHYVHGDDDNEPASAEPGAILSAVGSDSDRPAYRILRTLGRGAFSRVVLARREDGDGNEGSVAIKLMDRRTIDANPRMRISVVREVEVLKVRPLVKPV